MTVGSLFAGIGGFDLACEQEGCKVIYQAEIDKTCCEVLKRHFPGVRQYNDITKLQSADVAPVDIMCGGFPCQDLSSAGQRRGLAGQRSGLFFEFVRFIAAKRPQWVIIENVPGLLLSDAGRDMGTVLASLGNCGYGYAYRVLDAQYFGLAQRRKRVFIIGHLGEPWSAPAKVLFESNSSTRSSTSCKKKKHQIAGTLGGGSDRRGWCCDFDRSGAFIPVRSYTLRSRMGAPQGHNETFVSNDHVRRLTPLEWERLQGFPDDWTRWKSDGKKISDSVRYRMLGNAVAVPVVRWIVHRLLKEAKNETG